MKNFSNLEEQKERQKLDVQENSINYINAQDLQTYLTVADKFISPEAKEIVNWLIVNNETYPNDLNPERTPGNDLAAFYNKGVPTDDSKRELYKNIGKLSRAGRLLEIPVFQTQEQFEDIINKRISPDEILLDLDSEAGRAAVYAKYKPLIYKIVNQFLGKSTMSYEDLMSAANFGLVYAMNTFQKPKLRNKETGKWEDTGTSEKHAAYTFTSYAASNIRTTILREIRDESHLVRVPISQQKREKDEKGFITKTHAVSGDKTVGHDSEGNGKTLFDYIDNAENYGKNIDREDLEVLWKDVYKALEEKFGKEEMELFYKCYHLNGFNTEEDRHKKQKDIAAEYGLKPNTLNQRLGKIIKYILNNKKMKDMFTDILELTHECKQAQWEEEDQLYEERHMPTTISLDEE